MYRVKDGEAIGQVKTNQQEGFCSDWWDAKLPYAPQLTRVRPTSISSSFSIHQKVQERNKSARVSDKPFYTHVSEEAFEDDRNMFCEK